jgi:hypothetical protein
MKSKSEKDDCCSKNERGGIGRMMAVLISGGVSVRSSGKGVIRKTLFRRINTLYICCNYREKWK